MDECELDISLKNWCFWTVVLGKTPESPLDCKEMQPVHSEGDQSWIFIGRTDAKAETPILWQPDAKNWLIGKDPDAVKDRRLEERGMTEDEMVGWHHQINGHEFEQALGDGEGQGSLACCSPWGHKELDTTEWLNWTEGRKRKMTERGKEVRKEGTRKVTEVSKNGRVEEIQGHYVWKRMNNSKRKWLEIGNQL